MKAAWATLPDGAARSGLGLATQPAGWSHAHCGAAGQSDRKTAVSLGASAAYWKIDPCDASG